MRTLIAIIVLCFSLSACEDVIDLDVPTETPRLVIDANIVWFKGSTGNEQTIRLSLTAPYFDTSTPPALGATVQVSNSLGDTYDFIDLDTNGIYKSSSFTPILNETYSLRITYDGAVYTGEETLLPVSSIAYVEQKLDGGFDGETTEIKAYYTDPADEENYYLYQFENDITVLPSLEVYDDEFSNGNQIFAFYSNEDVSSGDEIRIKAFGISARFYEYMFVLLQQNSESDGGPFETQPAIVKGNCVNTTNQAHFPLGYFRLSQADRLNYTIQ